MCKHMFQTHTIYGEPVKVPCGSCITCFSTKQRFFSHRIQCDVASLNRQGVGSSFCTLTYNDDPHTISKADFQKFFKRLRKSCDRPFKYLALGDYGGKTQRPHYHFLGIGLPSEVANHFVRKSWPFGFCDVEPITSGNINYVVRYISKMDSNYKQAFADAGVEQPFSLKSLGLGNTLFEQQYDTICDTGRYIWNGRSYAVPPYWLAKLGVLPKRPDFSSVVPTAKRLGFNDAQSYLDYRATVKEYSAMRRAQNMLKPPQGLKHLPDHHKFAHRTRQVPSVDDIIF